MRRARILAVALGLTAILAAAPASAAGSYRATMTAGEEVPTPGPPGGQGTADIMLDQPGQLCYTLTYSGIDEPATAAHVHKGAKGAAGPVFVDLDMPKNGNKGCVPVDASKAKAIGDYPDQYYVNVHTKQHPNGAIRGQLQKV